MIGIKSCGVYVPLRRLDLGSLGKRGEKAIANFDEDSLTMGVAAGMNCLRDCDRDAIDGLFFASSSYLYGEKQTSVTAATALDLREDILAVDFANSLRAGTNALKLAIDSVKGGGAKNILVIASDMRTAQPGSELELLLGDGAAAILIGDTEVAAEYVDSYWASHEMLDVWRAHGDAFVRTWEDRFIYEEGYLKVLPKAISKLMDKHNLNPKAISKAIIYAPDSRRHRMMAERLGFDLKTQVQDPFFDTVGNTGAAFALMMLVATLEEANQGDTILMANYGDGADAILFQITQEIDAIKSKQRMPTYLRSKKVVNDYLAYAAGRGLIDKAPAARRPEFRTPSPSAMLREVDKNLRLVGTKCKKCGTPQYPPQRICSICHTRDEYERYRFSDKEAKVYTYTKDNLAPILDPPLVVALVDFEGGGRTFCQITDHLNNIQIGMPVEMTFRKFYTSEGINNYIWKCMPKRE